MVKTFNFITVIFIFLLLISCGKEDYIGPPIEAQFGELIILEPFSSDKPVGVDFSLNDTVRFFSEFSISANYNINISGRNSGANFTISGTGKNLSNVFWAGNSDNIFFKQYEWCDVVLSFDNSDTTLSDSILILGERDFSNLGYLLTSYEDPSEYGLVNSQNTTQLQVLNNSSIAIHGNNFLDISGEGSNTYFGATRISIPLGGISEPDKSNIFFNGFFKSDLNGSAVVVKMFEDENNDGSYDQGIDEAWTYKFTLNSNGVWNKESFNFDNFTVDQTAGNVQIDGNLNVGNIIRLDVVCSQNGNSFGNFGYFVDYLILTYNSSL